MKILLIYHQPSTLLEFEKFANAYGHQLCCCSGISGVGGNVHENSSDLIAVELNNPIAELLPMIEAQKRLNPALALVFLGDGSEDQISQALEQGVDAYLTQPLHAKLLTLTLRSLLRKSRALFSTMVAQSDTSKIEEELKNSQQRQREAVAEKDLTYRELLLAYSRLQELNQQKTNFLAAATHELRTPVTVMKGYNRILLDGRLGELLPRQKEVLLESEQSCTRLIKIINSLLDLSRIEAGKLDLTYQDYNLATNIEKIVNQLKDGSKRKRLSVVLRVDKHLPLIRCDRERINQVLANLLENAIKYTPSGGNIYVSARLCPSGKTSLPASDLQRTGHQPFGEGEDTLNISGPAIMVQVSDTGIGISGEHKQEIFEQFTQVSSNQMDRSGLGLGLAISKRIVQAHGGKIRVDSQPHSGSHFTFLLPLSPAEAVTVAEMDSQ